MLTQKDIGHVIYDDCCFLNLPIYLKDSLPDAEVVSGEERVQPRVVIRPKFVANDKTYFNDCTVEVNIVFPDIDGECNPKLGDCYSKALKELDNDKCGRCGEEFYRYHVERHGIEADENLSCHYANITLLFEILNVRR